MWIGDEVLEESSCWLFLMSQALKFTEGGQDSAVAALVVSKKGKVMIVADHNRDPVKLREYFSEVSRYLARRDE